MAQKIMLSLAVFFCWTFALKAEEYKLSSPDKRLEVKLRVEGRTEFEVWYDKVKLVEPSVIGMNLSDGRHVGGDLVTSVKKDRVNRKIDVVAGKNKTLKEAYNEIVLSYGTDYDLVVRAYNEGWAYRFDALGQGNHYQQRRCRVQFRFYPYGVFPGVRQQYRTRA